MSKNKKTEIEENRIAALCAPGKFDPKTYEFDSNFKEANIENPFEVHTTAEMVACIEALERKGQRVELDARVIGHRREAKTLKSISKESFCESFKGKNANRYKMREFDTFQYDYDDFGGNGLVGRDFTPFLGGPFFKNLYYYQDYIRMHAQAFFARHHDPFGKATVDITSNFVLGRGFRVDCDNKKALAVWRAFEQVNDLVEQMENAEAELSTYGETMIWKLPNDNTKIVYGIPEAEIPKGVLPRVRLIDPSNIVEIVTYPEDITRRLFYVWLAPTQYQSYTGAGAKSEGQETKIQPSLKFIYRHIPADQVLHITVNSVSNEKRGRSDLFPVLGYMKRLRDSINYEMIGHQKQSAWSIDTTIEGSQTDVDTYVQAIQSLGTIPNAGSEFAHTAKVKRELLETKAGSGGTSEIFSWCLSNISAGTLIPVSYYGTHLHGSQARGAALVATEPVAKKFEKRQELLTRVVKKLWTYLFQDALGWEEVPDCEVTFPDIITQDRSAKLKDLALSQDQKWLSKKTAAIVAAKEMGIDSYEYEAEQELIKKEAEEEAANAPSFGGQPSGGASFPAPLSSDPKVQKAVSGGDTPPKPAGGLTGTEKKAIKDNYGA